MDDKDRGAPPDLAPPKGTTDLLPPESWRVSRLARLAMDTFAGAGYGPVDTPIFEHTEIFERGVGATSEVVGKQMYTFTDRGGRSLTLRPELTAPVVRAVLAANLQRGPLPVKLAYAGPMFRQERPQKGRYRQFYQVGIEAMGSALPAVDAEVIEIGSRFLASAGVETTLLLNSIGHVDSSCRTGYLKLLVEYLEEQRDRLAPVDAERVHTNPLRVFDSKEEATRAALEGAPYITDHLCDDCAKHFESVRALLEDLGVGYELEPRLVRGLDYYTRTAFEFVDAGGQQGKAARLGSQNAFGGGGRYDGLAESLGGDALPGIGFALGLDRILIGAGGGPDDDVAGGPVNAYVVAIGAAAARPALSLATRLRASGLGVDLDLMGRSVKGQMKDAARSGARWAVILGDAEIASGESTLRDLTSGAESRVALEDLAGLLAP
ncbi:MAG: histidine--tRNA ligase [Actinobacteria bacterium]|nr:histidine--tRNA ligase [Actinomycetota bacterium]